PCSWRRPERAAAPLEHWRTRGLWDSSHPVDRVLAAPRSLGRRRSAEPRRRSCGAVCRSSNVLARPAPCRAGPSDPNTTAVTPPRPRRPNRAAAQAADRARTAAVAVARSRARPFRLLSRQTNRGPYANRPGLPKGSARSVVFELDELSLG